MALSVTFSATSTDGALTTTAALRQYLGTTSTADDTRQLAQIVAASRWAEGYVGYPFQLQGYRETVPGFGVQRLMLSRFPIVAVQAIYNTTTTDDATSYTSTEVSVEDPDAGFLHTVNTFPWSARVAYDMAPFVAPQSERSEWLVDYCAGYRLAGSTTTGYGTTSTGETLPADVALAVQMKAAEYYERTGDISSKTVGDLSITYRGQTFYGHDNDQAVRLLQPYRRRP
jgi:hypothetical protein